jgi:hypothetical protein
MRVFAAALLFAGLDSAARVRESDEDSGRSDAVGSNGYARA